MTIFIQASTDEPSIYSIKSSEGEIKLFYSKMGSHWRKPGGLAAKLVDTGGGVDLCIGAGLVLDYMELEQLGMLIDEYRRVSGGFKYRRFVEVV